MLGNLWRYLFGPRWWAVEYAPDDVEYFEQLTTSRTCVAGAHKFGGCWRTGVFRRKRDAAAFAAHVAYMYADEWPLIPTIVIRLSPSDSRVEDATI